MSLIIVRRKKKVCSFWRKIKEKKREREKRKSSYISIKISIVFSVFSGSTFG